MVFTIILYYSMGLTICFQLCGLRRSHYEDPSFLGITDVMSGVKHITDPHYDIEIATSNKKAKGDIAPGLNSN